MTSKLAMASVHLGGIYKHAPLVFGAKDVCYTEKKVQVAK